MSVKLKQEVFRFIKFGIVGATNTINSLWIYYLLLLFGCNYLVSTVVGYVLSSIIGYFLNKVWVFKENKVNTKKSLFRYYTVYISSLVINMILMYVWVDLLQISDKIAPLLTLLITVPYNFVFSRLWVFRSEKKGESQMKQKVNKKDWIKQNWLFLIILMVFIGISFFILGLNFFNHPVADDYSNMNAFLYALNGQQLTIGNFFTTAFKVSLNIYKTWQGTYFSNIIFYLNPLTFSIRTYQITMLVTQLFYFFSVFFFLFGVRKLLPDLKKTTISIIAMVFILFSVCFMYSPQEGLYWFTGTSLYLLPFSLSLIFLGLLCYFMKNHRKALYFVLVLLAICLAGTSYVTGLFLGLVLLLITIDSFLRNNKMKWYYLVLLVIFTIGFAFNVFCPGNFMRTSNFVETTIPKAVLMAFPLAFKMFVRTIFKTTLVPLCILLIPVFVKVIPNVKYKFRYPILVPIILLLGFVVFFMPCTYSYGTFYEEPRVQNIQFFYLVMILVFILFHSIGYIIQNKKWNAKNINLFYWIGSLLFFVMLVAIGTDNFKTTNIVNDLMYGNAIKYDRCINQLYDTLEDSKEKVIEVENCPTTTSSLQSFYFSEEEDNWVNKALEEYFKKEIILKK